MKTSGAATREMLTASIARARSLPGSIRARAESLFNVDLRDVRIAEDDAVRRMGAQAIAIGNHVIFAPAHANFHSPEGVALLGHELAHVVQQRGLAGRSTGPATVLLSDPALELAADRAGWAMARDLGLLGRDACCQDASFHRALDWRGEAGPQRLAQLMSSVPGAVLQANWFTDAARWTAETLVSLAKYMWEHKREVIVVGAIVLQVRAAPDVAAYLGDLAVQAGVSMVVSHVVMRVVRMVDANLQVRSPLITWPLGAAVLGTQGAIQYLAASRLMPTNVSFLPSTFYRDRSNWFTYALGNILSHAFYDGWDFSKALSPRREYDGPTSTHVLYVKFPAPDLGLLQANPWLFVRGHLVPYKGIAGGHSDPSSTSGKRHDTHHWEPYGFGPWFVIAASENKNAIQYLERLAIRWLGAAKHIKGAHIGQSQQDLGVTGPAALGWKGAFVEEFIVWHFKDGIKHIAGLFEPVARAGLSIADALPH